MPDDPERLVANLKRECQKTLDFFQALTSEQYDQMIYTEGAGWKIRQILAHFVASEVAIRLLIENILAGGAGAPEDFKLDEYNERWVTKLFELTPAELLQQFSTARQASVDLVSRMSPSDLERSGRHPFLGIASLEAMVKLLYRHNQLHQRDIRRAFG